MVTRRNCFEGIAYEVCSTDLFIECALRLQFKPYKSQPIPSVLMYSEYFKNYSVYDL